MHEDNFLESEYEDRHHIPDEWDKEYEKAYLAFRNETDIADDDDKAELVREYDEQQELLNSDKRDKR